MANITADAGTALYAGFWRRFLALIIDDLVLLIPGILVNVIISSAFNSGSGSGGAVAALVYILWVVAIWLYFAIQESGTAQATIGKRALSIKVTNLDGGRISFGQATGRYFGKLISAVILAIGFMMAGWTEKKQALHDMMAGTLVIRSV